MLEGASELIYRGFPPNGMARDPAFPACLACALVDRARDRMGVGRDGVCGECFARVCPFLPFCGCVLTICNGSPWYSIAGSRKLQVAHALMSLVENVRILLL